MSWLSKAIDDAPALQQEVHVVDAFYLTLNWLTPKQRESIYERSRERNSREVNTAKFTNLFARATVADWRGLTLETLVGSLGVAVLDDELPGLVALEKKNGGLPFSPEDAVALYRNAKSALVAEKIGKVYDDWELDEKLAEVAKQKKVSASPGTSS